MRTRAERRELTERKVRQRERLANDLGLQQGTVYQKHREKNLYVFWIHERR